MSDFIEVGKVSKKTLIRTITFSCVGRIDRRKLEQFQKELTALLAEYGLKCVPAKPGGSYGGGKDAAGAQPSSRGAGLKRARAAGSRGRKTGSR
jgi:hypothetical protein